MAHFNLANSLFSKDDLDGSIAEYREALRVNPNEDDAHNNLGVALEHKGDLRGALEEYRAAFMLNPKSLINKDNYERLLQQVNK
jgi:Flp pilus assembly protein TadD